MEIELKITKDSLDNLTWGDWEAIQEGSMGYAAARRIIASFMVKDGEPVPFDEAMEILKVLKTGEMRLVFENFTQAIKKTTESFVPNQSGGD